MRILLAFLLGISSAWAQPQTQAQTSQEHSFRVVTVAAGLDHPWSIAFLSDGRLLVTERVGRLRLVDKGKLQSVEGLPEIAQHGQGGLFDVVLHPEYAKNSLIYVSYAGRGDDGYGT